MQFENGIVVVCICDRIGSQSICGNKDHLAKFNEILFECIQSSPKAIMKMNNLYQGAIPNQIFSSFGFQCQIVHRSCCCRVVVVRHDRRGCRGRHFIANGCNRFDLTRFDPICRGEKKSKFISIGSSSFAFKVFGMFVVCCLVRKSFL